MNQEQFISECGKSYPEVMAALAYFRRSIQQECKPVVQKRIKEIAAAVGISQDLTLTEFSWPDKPALAHNDQFQVGWQARRGGPLPLFLFVLGPGKRQKCDNNTRLHLNLDQGL